MLLILFVNFFAPASSFATQNPETLFTWNEANNIFLNAKSQEDYFRAAKKYQQLLNANVNGWQIYFNFGTALLRSGLYDDAIKALEIAGELTGKNSDIETNLIAAYSKKEGRVMPLPWYRKLFFWHYNYSIATRIKITIVSFAFIWPGLILKRLKLQRFSKYLLLASLLVFFLFSSSLLTSFHQFATFNPALPSSYPFSQSPHSAGS
jgi:tetratricopeptide (TPR) repeat protein